MPRISAVNTIKVNSLTFSSTVLIGDSTEITPVSRALAVQREAQIFYENEGDFASFPIFSQPIPKPEITERITINRINQSPIIKVNHVKVLGISSSSVFQVGSTKIIDAEARVKHIRQLLDVD
jgi:spore germination protein PE